MRQVLEVGKQFHMCMTDVALWNKNFAPCGEVPVKVIHSTFPSPHGPQATPTASEEQRLRWIKGDSFVIVRQACLQLALLFSQPSPSMKRQRPTGVKTDGLLKIPHGRLHIAETFMKGAPIVPRRSCVRLQRNGCVVVCYSFRMFVELVK